MEKTSVAPVDEKQKNIAGIIVSRPIADILDLSLKMSISYRFEEKKQISTHHYSTLSLRRVFVQ